MTEHLAIGPDGGNLLGFLASVGALATLSNAWSDSDVRLSWRFHEAAWRPVLHVSEVSREDEILDALDASLSLGGLGRQCVELGDDLPVAAEQFAKAVARAQESACPEERRHADFLTAFGSEVCTDARGRIQDTALRTMSGAGHQHFLKFMRDLAAQTTREHLRSALFEPWEYSDKGPTMRWDPADDRRYAYRADDPASSTRFPIRTVRGANRLAVEALPCFPTAPRGGRLETTAFPRSDGGRALRWPIWDARVTLPTLRSLLGHPDLATQPPLPVTRLADIGVVEVFRSRRVTAGQFRNFTPAEALLRAGGPAAA